MSYFAPFNLPQNTQVLDINWFLWQIIALSTGHYLYIYMKPTQFLVMAQEINLPHDLSLPGKPGSKSRIVPFCIMVFCYITNFSNFRLFFEEKTSFLDLRRQREVLCRSECGSVV